MCRTMLPRNSSNSVSIARRPPLSVAYLLAEQITVAAYLIHNFRAQIVDVLLLSKFEAFLEHALKHSESSLHTRQRIVP
jgi:hypothetical protein